MLLSMVLVLCLAVAGIGYAHWTKTLYVDGTVETGTFGVEWSQYDATDNEDLKDVGKASCYIIGNTVHLEILNAYPSYTATFNLDIHCTGSVPAHINSVDVVGGPFLDVQVIGIQECMQLHYCDEIPVTVIIHVLQEDAAGALCPQDALLTCSATIVADQFNA